MLALFGKIYAIDPDPAQQLLDPAQTGLKHQDWYVRMSALELCSKLVEVSPNLAQQLLEPAQTGLKDSDNFVRQSTLELSG